VATDGSAVGVARAARSFATRGAGAVGAVVKVAARRVVCLCGGWTGLRNRNSFLAHSMIFQPGIPPKPSPISLALARVKVYRWVMASAMSCVRTYKGGRPGPPAGPPDSSRGPVHAFADVVGGVVGATPGAGVEATSPAARAVRRRAFALLADMADAALAASPGATGDATMKGGVRVATPLIGSSAWQPRSFTPGRAHLSFQFSTSH